MAKRSKEQIKRDNALIKKIYKSYQLRVRRDDEQVISKLESLENKNGYLLDLIRKDLQK